MHNYKRMLIYPYQASDIAFVKFFEKFQNKYCLGSVCSSSGSGYIGKDVAFAENRNPIGYIVENISLELVNNHDGLIMMSNTNQVIHDKSVSLVKYALVNKKEVICLMELSVEESQELLSLANTYGSIIRMNLHRIDNMLVTQHMQISSKIKYPKAPVIFVGSLIENGDTEEIITNLALACKRAGYKTSCLLKSEKYTIFNMHSFDFILQMHDFRDIIKHINYLIYAVSLSENPDCIIIEVPGNMIQHSDNNCGDFGLNAFIMSQAEQSDFFILSTDYADYTEPLIEKLSDDFMQKFSFGIDAVHLSNKIIEPQQSIEIELRNRILGTIKVDDKKYRLLLNKLKEYPLNTAYHCLLDENECDSIVNNFIKKLA